MTVMRDEAGTLQAACDWWLVTEGGQWSPYGHYVFLNQLDVTPGVNLHTVRQHLVREISRLAPYAVGVYWERREKPARRLHAFRREQLQQLREEVGV